MLRTDRLIVGRHAHTLGTPFQVSRVLLTRLVLTIYRSATVLWIVATAQTLSASRKQGHTTVVARDVQANVRVYHQM